MWTRILSPQERTIEAVQPRLCLWGYPSVDFYLRVLSVSPVPEREPNGQGAPRAPRFNGKRGRVIGTATAKTGSFVHHGQCEGTIGVIVSIDLERGEPAECDCGDRGAERTRIITAPRAGPRVEKHYGR